MMTATTKRDQVWMIVIDAIQRHNPVQTDDITDNVDVSAKTARAVLGVAEDKDLLRRDSPRAQTWYPTIGPLGVYHKVQWFYWFTSQEQMFLLPVNLKKKQNLFHLVQI